MTMRRMPGFYEVERHSGERLRLNHFAKGASPLRLCVRAWNKHARTADAPRRSRSVGPLQASSVWSVAHTSKRVILSVAPGGSGRAGREVEGSPISGESAGVSRGTLRAVSQTAAHPPTAAKPPAKSEVLQLRSAPRRLTARCTPFRMTRNESVSDAPYCNCCVSSTERLRRNTARKARCISYRNPSGLNRTLLGSHKEQSWFFDYL